MPKEIYNEGRVVGMSAYEIYLRHQLSEYPDMTSATEREWLSSTLGDGSSMILCIPKGTPEGIFEKMLPSNSTLCAASTIIGHPFDGEAEFTADGSWATKITSYGSLISNTQDSHPNESGSSVPAGTEWSREKRMALKEYMNIVDGIVYHPGTWEKNDEGSPYMDFTSPDLNKPGYVRIRISKTLQSNVYVLLTGWAHRSIVAGSSKIEQGATSLINPQNGDFLGPERFPWSVKITFVVSSEVMNIINDKAYVRKLPTSSDEKSVTAKAIIDFDSCSADTYYQNDKKMYPNNVSSSAVTEQVTELNVTGDGASVLSIYQRDDIKHSGKSGQDYPPILYGKKVTSSGSQKIVPIDTGAPGTVKLFEDKQAAISYPKVIPNTYSMYHDKQNKSIYFVEDEDIISLDTKIETKNIGTASSPKYASIITSGNSKATAISLQKDNSGTMLDTSGSSGQIDVVGNTRLSWSHLLSALGLGKVIDLIGDQLRRFRNNLPDITSGDKGVLKITGTGQSSIAGDLKVGTKITAGQGVAISNTVSGTNYHVVGSQETINFNKPIRSGSNYIEFTQPSGGVLRLYISSTAPSTEGVPVGSIGIGW